MQLIRFNPIRDIFSIRNRNKNMDLFSPILWGDEKFPVWNWRPVVDIYDDENRVVINAELPGIDKKDIVIDVKDRLLTLKGERSTEKEVKEDKYHRRERAYGKFKRVFSLPAEVDPDKIKANFKDGILKIDIPKPKEQKPKKIAVNE